MKHPSGLNELGNAIKDLIQSEINLIKTEIKESSSYLGKHTAEVAVFGALAAISILPFLAFLVIGLGEILEGKFWLSSLIVAGFCATVGGFFAFRAYKKIKERDLSLPKTRESLVREKDLILNKAHELKETAAENVRDIRDAAKRKSA